MIAGERQAFRLSFREELAFMLSWDRTSVPKKTGYITSNFLSREYTLIVASSKSKHVQIIIEL